MSQVETEIIFKKLHCDRCKKPLLKQYVCVDMHLLTIDKADDEVSETIKNGVSVKRNICTACEESVCKFIDAGIPKEMEMARIMKDS